MGQPHPHGFVSQPSFVGRVAVILLAAVEANGRKRGQTSNSYVRSVCRSNSSALDANSRIEVEADPSKVRRGAAPTFLIGRHDR